MSNTKSTSKGRTLNDSENIFEFPDTVKFEQVKTMESTSDAGDNQNPKEN